MSPKWLSMKSLPAHNFCLNHHLVATFCSPYRAKTPVATHRIYIYLPWLNWSRIEESTTGRVCVCVHACACLRVSASEELLKDLWVWVLLSDMWRSVTGCLVSGVSKQHSCLETSEAITQWRAVAHKNGEFNCTDVNAQKLTTADFYCENRTRNNFIIPSLCSEFILVSLKISVNLLKLEQRPLKRGTAGCP